MAERSVWRMLWYTVKKSFRIFPENGKLIGEDSLGNKYYEAPKKDESIRKTAPRWFVPENSDWEQDMPAEWEAWLRNRRKEPPTVEEIQYNLSIANMKKENAKKLETSESKAPVSKEIAFSKGFPVQNTFERNPGRSND